MIDNAGQTASLYPTSAPLMLARAMLETARLLHIRSSALEKCRSGGGMETNTSAMSDEDMRDVSEYFAAQELPLTPFKADPSKVALGRQTANDLQCAGCHQPDYKGKDEYPRLAGQWWDYLTAQIENFRTGRRSHSGAAATDAARNPGPQDAENLAHYLTQLK
jgi:cytochrome c553